MISIKFVISCFKNTSFQLCDNVYSWIDKFLQVFI